MKTSARNSQLLVRHYLFVVTLLSFLIALYVSSINGKVAFITFASIFAIAVPAWQIAYSQNWDKSFKELPQATRWNMALSLIGMFFTALVFLMGASTMYNC